MRRNASKEAVNATANPEGAIPGVTPKTRKTKEVKMLEDLANVEKRQHNLQSTIGAANGKKVQENFDIKIITAQTIEGLMEFLGILPDGHLYELDRNLARAKGGREQSREGRPTLMSQKMKMSSRAASR